MGRYLNVDNSLFKEDLNSDIYADKSLIIEKLNKVANKQNKFICVSRPRRFGKTMATTLINVYYSKGCDSRELFSNLKIADTPNWDKSLNKFNVIKIDMNAEYENIEDKTNFLKIMSKRIIKALAKQFSQCNLDINKSLEYNLYDIYDQTKEQCFTPCHILCISYRYPSHSEG